MMLEVSELDIRKALKRDNPWWVTGVVPKLYKQPKRRAYFESFKKISLDRAINRAVILMGPRRVGKTVILYQLIDDVISSGFNAKNILFVSVDTPLYSDLTLEKIVFMFNEEVAISSDEKQLVIFDEIQYLKDWEIHLKVLIDKYPNIKFIASGSAAAALKLKSNESGAGRFTDFILPPLTFAEFLNFRDQESNLIIKEDIGHTYRYRSEEIDKLNDEFIKYINFGGYPEAVINKKISGNTQQYLGRDIIDKVLLKDLPILYGIQDIQELNKLFTSLAYSSGREVSLENIASSSGVSKNTIKKYIEYMEAAFLICRVNRVDDSAKGFKKQVTFKIYLTNPSMRSALFGDLHINDDAMGFMAETAIFSQWFHSSQIRNIHYARWKDGRKDYEVDLVKVAAEKNFKPQWAYEVKWSDRYTEKPEELKGLIKFVQRNLSLNNLAGSTTKSISKITEINGVSIRHFPCALHCYQIGKNLIEGRPV